MWLFHGASKGALKLSSSTYIWSMKRKSGGGRTHRVREKRRKYTEDDLLVSEDNTCGGVQQRERRKCRPIERDGQGKQHR
jgi:hypothetical protein